MTTLGVRIKREFYSAANERNIPFQASYNKPRDNAHENMIDDNSKSSPSFTHHPETP